MRVNDRQRHIVDYNTRYSSSTGNIAAIFSMLHPVVSVSFIDIIYALKLVLSEQNNIRDEMNKDIRSINK